MFDDRSFDRRSFEEQAWLMSALATARREVVRLSSFIWRVVTLQSRI